MSAETTAFRYDLILFDVGGTLIGFHDPAPYREFLAQAGLPATEEDARRFYRTLMGIIRSERDGAQGLGAEGGDLLAWWQGNFAKAWPGRPDLAEAMTRWLYAGRFDTAFVDSVPALEALRQMGLPLGILSNFDTHLEEMLHRLGLRDYFDFVIASAAIGLAKPDRRAFDAAVARAARPRHRILYVGDHVGDDVEGARGAGLDVVLIDRSNRQPDALCPRISSLLELAGYVCPPPGPVQAVILDMDGVVLDSPAAHLRSWQHALAPLGLEPTAADLHPLEGMPTELIGQSLVEQLTDGSCSLAEACRLADAKRALFRQDFEPRLVPAIGPLLHDLHGRGYRLGLVTGSARSVVEESLVPTGVVGLFEVVVTGDDIVRGKPHAEPYQEAAARLGLPPAACLVVENAPQGIQSALAAGMGCAALETTLPAERLAAADMVFPDARALRAWLLAAGLGRDRPGGSQGSQ